MPSCDLLNVPFYSFGEASCHEIVHQNSSRKHVTTTITRLQYTKSKQDSNTQHHGCAEQGVEVCLEMNINALFWLVCTILYVLPICGTTKWLPVQSDR